MSILIEKEAPIVRPSMLQSLLEKIKESLSEHKE